MLLRESTRGLRQVLPIAVGFEGLHRIPLRYPANSPEVPIPLTSSRTPTRDA